MNLIATFGSRDTCTCKSACLDAMTRGNLSRVLGVSPAGEAPNASNVATSLDSSGPGTGRAGGKCFLTYNNGHSSNSKAFP